LTDQAIYTVAANFVNFYKLKLLKYRRNKEAASDSVKFFEINMKNVKQKTKGEKLATTAKFLIQ
jgi:hypothetical protein